MPAKPSECMTGFKELEYLAHIVRNWEIRPVHQKVEAINKLPPPKTKKQIRSFIGMIEFYRKFIPHFAEISAILSDLTMKGKINVKKIAFGNKEHTTDKQNGSLGFIETLRKQ